MSAGTVMKTLEAGVLLDLDAIAQQCCGEIASLVGAAINALALDAGALVRVRHLLQLIEDRASLLGDAINSTAEEYGCNYIDDSEIAFVDRLQAKNKGGAA